MTVSIQRRLLWPFLGLAAVGAVGAGTRVSLTEPVVTLVGVVVTTLGAAMLLALPGLAALALLSRRSLTMASRFGVVLCGSGIAAYVDFWAWIPSPTLGRVIAIALLLASAAAIAIAQPTVLLDDPELRRPFGILLLVVFAYLGLAYSQGGFGGVHWARGGTAGNTTLAMAYRYWLAPDNTLPLLFAQRLANHGSLTVPILGTGPNAWHTSDRPPLQTGFALMVFPFSGLKVFAYQFIGTVLEALWIPALWILLRSRGVGAVRVLVVVLCTAATGAIFLNTIYVWPKMLAGAFALAALAVLLEGGSLALAVALAALALMSHGGVAFSLLALLLIIWKLRPKRKQVALAVAAAAAVYLPWAAYQNFLDPPGNRLLKYQLAGVITQDRHSFLHDLVTQYLNHPLHSFLLNKLFNIQVLAYIGSIWRTTPPGWGGFLVSARGAEITSLLVAAGPLLLGLLALASPAARRSLRPLLPVFAFVLVSVACWVVLEFGGTNAATVIHQGSYAVLVLTVALPALMATYLPRAAAVTIVGVSLAWFCVAWLPGVGYRWAQPGIASETDWAMVALGLGSLAVIGWLVWRAFAGAAPHDHAPSDAPRSRRPRMRAAAGSSVYVPRG
jgi:hypothetical protein